MNRKPYKKLIEKLNDEYFNRFGDIVSRGAIFIDLSKKEEYTFALFFNITMFYDEERKYIDNLIKKYIADRYDIENERLYKMICSYGCFGFGVFRTVWDRNKFYVFSFEMKEKEGEGYEFIPMFHGLVEGKENAVDLVQWLREKSPNFFFVVVDWKID